MIVVDLENASVEQVLTHPLMMAKIAVSSSNKPRNTIRKELQIHTKLECEFVNAKTRHHPLIFDKTHDAIWSVDMDLLAEEAPELLSSLDRIRNFDPDNEEVVRRYVFTTFHQSFAYEDFIEGIKPVLEETSNGDIEYEIVPGVFKNIVERARKDPDHRYAIFIDEINRGNIAEIFGELITLIEDDKREQGDHPLAARLPYSKKDFSVPSNLYIYGTMNTADRSVEALDTALRRRFTFVEIPPQPGIINNHEALDVDLPQLLTAINNRVYALLDKDHMIGHSYLMNVHKSKDPIQELRLTFANRILPLLQEYFYGEVNKIALILGDQFITKNEEENDSLWPRTEFDAPDIPHEKTYSVKDPLTLDAPAFRSIYEKS